MQYLTADRPGKAFCSAEYSGQAYVSPLPSGWKPPFVAA